MNEVAENGRRGAPMNQADLDALMVKNFLRGLRRKDEARTVSDANTVQEVIAEWDRYDRPDYEYAECHTPRTLAIRDIEAAALEAVMAVRAGRWMDRRTSFYTCDSPLERVLDMALYVEGERRTDGEVLFAHCSDARPHSEQPAAAPSQISICHQHRVGVYRLDFLVSGYQYDFDANAIVDVAKVAVEVDGHEFHEKTKEQAQHDKAKDRELQRCGLTVFRFTGAEVYRDPFKVAAEIVDAALAKPARP